MKWIFSFLCSNITLLCHNIQYSIITIIVYSTIVLELWCTGDTICAARGAACRPDAARGAGLKVTMMTGAS